MKNHYLYYSTRVLVSFALFCIGTSKAIAQEEREYVPFVEEGKVWYCGYEHGWGTLPATLEDPEGEGIDCTFSLCGDTLANDKVYKKVLCQFEEYYGDSEQHYYCAIREEAYQVFIIEEEETEEKLIYDFSNPGEILILTYNGYQIVRSDCERRQKFLPGQFEYSLCLPREEIDWRCRIGYWVEGVGAPFVNPFAFELHPTFYDKPNFGKHISVRSCIKDGKYIYNVDWMATLVVPTSIDDNNHIDNSPKDSKIHDLQGRRIYNTPACGIYIVNGKKMVVK